MIYEKPIVELVDFTALERLATYPDGENDELGVGGRPDLTESVVDWPDE